MHGITAKFDVYFESTNDYVCVTINFAYGDWRDIIISFNQIQIKFETMSDSSVQVLGRQNK